MVIAMIVVANDCHSDGYCASDSNVDSNGDGQTDWDFWNLEMTLTGPAPITNAVTEESFSLFWDVFPVGVVLVALTLFLFHCDLWRFMPRSQCSNSRACHADGRPDLACHPDYSDRV